MLPRRRSCARRIRTIRRCPSHRFHCRIFFSCFGAYALLRISARKFQEHPVWSFTIFQSPTPVTAPILRTWRHYWPFRRSTCDLQSGARLLLSRFLVQSGVGSRELLLGLVTQVCALTPRTRYRLQPFPSARRLVAARAPLTPANFRSSLAGLPPPPA